jgi:hypothetical protein
MDEDTVTLSEIAKNRRKLLGIWAKFYEFDDNNNLKNQSFPTYKHVESRLGKYSRALDIFSY